jgi:hypothetical protein
MLLWRKKHWKTYKTAVESFKTFRSLYQLRDVWPAPLNDVMYYVAYLSYTGLSAFTILTYNSGSSYTHKLHSLEDNTKSFLVGIKTQKTSKIIYSSADFNKFTKKIDTVAFVWFFFRLLFASAFSLSIFLSYYVSAK